MSVKTLSWDSEFFNQRVGEFICASEEFTPPENASNYDLIYVKCSQDCAIRIPSFSELFSEVKVIYQKRLVKEHPADIRISTLELADYNLDDLYELAYESGTYSRFRLDTNFSDQQFKDLFSRWIDASITGTMADGFFVCILDDKIQGFVTYRIQESVATIGLIAVSPESQGMGLGRALIQSVENDLLVKEIDTLRIPTQLKNEQACRFYEKLGYSAVERIPIKHFWRDTI